MLTKTKYVKLIISGILAYFLSAPESFAQFESQNLLMNCANFGDSYINLPNSNICLKIGGEVRSRFHVSSGPRIEVKDSKYSIELNDELTNRIDARGLLTFDTQKLINDKVVRTRLKLSGDAHGDLTFEEATAQYGNLYFGLTHSLGNLTYGEFALNANYNLYHADNITPLFGYSRDFFNLFNFGISLERITSSNPYNTWDMGYRGELFGDWGRIGYASGNQIHHYENAYVDKEHPAYINLTAEEKAVINDVRDLGVIAFYVGIGGELVAPFSPETKIGANGFYINGTLEKLGIPKIKLAQRIPDGENAGRPMDDMGDPISRADFVNSTPVMMERFKHTLVIPSEDESEEAYVRELKVTQGFSINGGITHAFSPQFGLHLNSGFYSITDHDLHANGLMIGTSLDYKFLDGLIFSINGEFLKTTVTYVGSNEAIKTEFEYDQEGRIDPAFSITFSVAQSF